MNIGQVLFKPLYRRGSRAVAPLLPASSKQAALKAGMGSNPLFYLDCMKASKWLTLLQSNLAIKKESQMRRYFIPDSPIRSEALALYFIH